MTKLELFKIKGTLIRSGSLRGTTTGRTFYSTRSGIDFVEFIDERQRFMLAPVHRCKIDRKAQKLQKAIRLKKAGR